MKTKKLAAHRPFPEFVYVTRLDAGLEDEVLLADLEESAAAAEITEDEEEKRIAVYRLIRVDLPLPPEIPFTEVPNDTGVKK